MHLHCRPRAESWAGAVILLLLAWLAPAQTKDSSLYVKDVAFALKELRSNCGHFFRLKGINWKTVQTTFLKEAREVKTHGDHLVLLVRLVARLKDGHASVRPRPKGKDVKWPLAPKGRQSGPGMFWCRSGKKIRRGNVPEAAVRPPCAVLPTPPFDQDLRLKRF